jgi:hypothetical protein
MSDFTKLLLSKKNQKGYWYDSAYNPKNAMCLTEQIISEYLTSLYDMTVVHENLRLYYNDVILCEIDAVFFVKAGQIQGVNEDAIIVSEYKVAKGHLSIENGVDPIIARQRRKKAENQIKNQSAPNLVHFPKIFDKTPYFMSVISAQDEFRVCIYDKEFSTVYACRHDALIKEKPQSAQCYL